MRVEVTRAGAGGPDVRTAMSGPRRVWVREVVLHCADIDDAAALAAVVAALPGADGPDRAVGGGWQVRLEVEVTAQRSWESPEQTGRRGARILLTAYEDERARRAERVRRAGRADPDELARTR